MKSDTCLPAGQPAKVYIEPTSLCNLDCRTCIRHSWKEPLGLMERGTFGRIMESLREFSPPPDVFFGGLGEPLLHPDIVDMIRQTKSLGGSVEIITNGTLLTSAVSAQLIDARLDMLWVSLDGATPESYSDVRLGAALPSVLTNLAAFRDLRMERCKALGYITMDGYPLYEKPGISIAFVAMKRNINDLPALLSLAARLSVSRFMVSNVLPYTREMCEEALYSNALMDMRPLCRLELPRIDINGITGKALGEAARAGWDMSIRGADPDRARDNCPFMESGSTAVSWQGNVSPCLPLLHSHTRFVHGLEHYCRSWVIGNVNDRKLADLWNLKEYADFRSRAEAFDFSPCSSCGGCDLSENNETDCQGSPFPACGGCPWAQGVVQCP